MAWLARMAARLLLATVALAMTVVGGLAADPLPSWRDGGSKRAIVDFVAAVTTPNSPDFVSERERIAVFDNDGTLWVEQPMYAQLAFVLDRVRALAPTHPDWKDTQPFKAVLDGDLAAIGAQGEAGLVQLVAATHAGMTVEQFHDVVTQWLDAARDRRFGRPYTDLVYQPMLEVLAYLRANGFKTYVVSGGGVEFMRPWAERVYGIPPEQVIGSSIASEFVMQGDRPALVRLPRVDFVDDGPGKPVGINRQIGRRPILAFGNSDGDLQMLQWTTMAGGRRLGVIVHHTDAGREYAYDRKSPVGKLDKALDAAARQGWLVVDMKADWSVVFPFEGK